VPSLHTPPPVVIPSTLCGVCGGEPGQGESEGEDKTVQSPHPELARACSTPSYNMLGI